MTEPRRLADIPRLVRAVGTLAGTASAAADAPRRAFERELEALRARYGTRRPVRVFYEIWHRPLLTVNGAHLISDVIALCGGVNVFRRRAGADARRSRSKRCSPRGPTSSSAAARRCDPATLDAGMARARRVAALRELPVRYVPPDLIQRQTPRIVAGRAGGLRAPRGGRGKEAVTR